MGRERGGSDPKACSHEEARPVSVKWAGLTPRPVSPKACVPKACQGLSRRRSHAGTLPEYPPSMRLSCPAALLLALSVPSLAPAAEPPDLEIVARDLVRELVDGKYP